MTTKDEAILQEALSAINKRDEERARDLLTRLIKKDKDNTEVWLWMSAVVKTKREREYCLKEVLRIDPENHAARRGLILIGKLPGDQSLGVPLRLQQRDWLSKIKRFSKLDEFLLSGAWQPVAAVLFVLLVIAAGVFGASNLFRPKDTAIRWDIPTDSPAFLTAEAGELATLPALLGPTPLSAQLSAPYTPTPLYVNTPHPRTEHYRSAIFAYSRGDGQAMLDNLEKLAAEEPDSADVQYYIGEAYRLLNKPSPAIQAYGRALKLQPKFAPAYLGMARARQAQSGSSWQTVRDNLERAIDSDPQMSEAYLELAALYIQRKAPKSALDVLQQAEVLIPDNPQLHFIYAQAYLLQDEYENAIDSAQRASELDVTSLATYRLLGEAYHEAGEPVNALEPLRLYTQYEPTDVQAWVWTAEGYAAYGLIDDAMDALSTAIKLDEDSFEALQQRGLIYLDLGEIELAHADLTAALDIRTDTYAGNVGMGQVLMAQEKYGTATFYFDRAVAYVDEDEDMARILYLRGQSLEGIDEVFAATRDYHALLDLPAASAPQDWRKFAQGRIAALATPTRTPRTVTITSTRKPTSTVTITTTRKPTLTITVTTTRKPTLTNTATFTPLPTHTPSITPTATPKPLVKPGDG